MVRVDPDNRCAVMVCYGRKLVVLPFRRDNTLDEIEVQDIKPMKKVRSTWNHQNLAAALTFNLSLLTDSYATDSQDPNFGFLYYNTERFGRKNRQRHRHTVSAWLLWTNSAHCLWAGPNVSGTNSCPIRHLHNGGNLTEHPTACASHHLDR